VCGRTGHCDPAEADLDSSLHKINTNKRNRRTDDRRLALIPTAQNDRWRSGTARSRTGVSCVERHERICADMARLAALICRRSVRAFGALRSGADRQI
jgi:hypothetical protein